MQDINKNKMSRTKKINHTLLSRFKFYENFTPILKLDSGINYTSFFIKQVN